MDIIWKDVTTFDLEKVISYDVGEVIRKIASNKYKGQSFLLNFKGLIYARYNYDDIDILNYIVLAAKRDLKYCKAYNTLALDADFCKLSINDINRNKLIWYNNGLIFFRFEEEKAGTLIQRK